MLPGFRMARVPGALVAVASSLTLVLVIAGGAYAAGDVSNPTLGNAGPTRACPASMSLAFGVQPALTTPGAFISPAVTVHVTVTPPSAPPPTKYPDGTITIALGANPSAGVLSGTTTVAIDTGTGTATFSDLSIDRIGTGYTLYATSNSLYGCGSADPSTSAAFDIAAPAEPHLTLAKAAKPGQFAAAGDVITYTIVLVNDGNVTLANPSVSDPSVSDLKCDSSPSSFAPEASITCTASHTVTSEDLAAGHVTNIATGRATFGGEQIDAAQVSITVGGPKPTELVGGETATPAPVVTPPVTSTSGHDSGGPPLPILALLACLALAWLGLASVLAQRRSSNAAR
jgi:hypothetical protein